MNGCISRGSDVMGLTTVVGRGSDVMKSPSYATLNKFTPAKKKFSCQKEFKNQCHLAINNGVDAQISDTLSPGPTSHENILRF
jgi:hypothetical protein